MKELEIIKAQFLSNDIDSEDREDNEKLLQEWEQGLIHNELYLSWQNHDITRDIAKKMKESYREFAMQLAENRNLTEKERMSLWAKQDACTFILSITEKDAKGAMQQIQSEIKRAISAT
jgi:hypothetical protein